jgi:hypothetical protein
MKTCGRMSVTFFDYGWTVQLMVRRGAKRQAVNVGTRRRDYLTPMKKGQARRALRGWMGAR